MDTSIRKHPSTFISVIVGIAIAILFNMFFYFAYSTLFLSSDTSYTYNSPLQAETQKCYNEQDTRDVYTKEQCYAKEGVWNRYDSAQQRQSTIVNGKEITIEGSCDVSAKVQRCTEAVQKKYTTNSGATELPGYAYNRNKFIAGVILGVSALIVAMGVVTVPAIAFGMAIGGVALLIGVNVTFWEYLNNPIRVIIVFLALVAVVVFSWKKLRRG